MFFSRICIDEKVACVNYDIVLIDCVRDQKKISLLLLPIFWQPCISNQMRSFRDFCTAKGSQQEAACFLAAEMQAIGQICACQCEKRRYLMIEK